MKKLLVLLAPVFVCAFAGAGLAVAQEEAPPNFVPVEVNACTYNERKDQDDFDRALGLMTEWMEENDSQPYAAIRLMPSYAGNPEFDFVYFGFWPDGATMGRDISQYTASASDAIEAWNDAVDCSAELFGSLMLKDPGDDTFDNFMLSVSDCSIADGRRNSDALDAISSWGGHRTGGGSSGGIWVWYPVQGGGDGDFDFKLLESHNDIVGYGNWWQYMVETESYNVRNELFEDLLNCDVARLYYGETIVNDIPQDNGD